MTYLAFNTEGSRAPAAFVRDSASNGVIVQVAFTDSGIGHAGWIVNGLNYAGSPGSLGAWTTHRSDLYPGQWTLRTPAGSIMGYVSTQAFAEQIVAVMTDYPVTDPTLD